MSKNEVAFQFLMFAMLCGAAGCGDDTASTSGDGGAVPGDASSADDASTSEQPVYAVVTAIFGDDSTTTSNVVLLDSLDGEQTLDLDSAAEFPEWASIAPFEGGLLIASGEAPEITRYAIDDDGSLVAGDTLSFANFGVPTVSFFHNVMFDPEHAQLRLEETGRVLWNPSELTIEGSVEAPEIDRERDGLAISASNAEGIAVREDGAFWPYFWHDEDWYAFAQDSQIGIYQKDGSVELLDVPCPAINIATQDEEGNIYFSGMVDTVAYQKLEPESTLERCVARVNAGEQTIAEGWPKSFEELTEGRPAGRFYYLRDGVGLLSVFHEERATVDPEDTFASFFADHWALWLVDLEAWTAERIEDRDFTSSNLFFSRVGERTFIQDVASDFSETVISEIEIDGTITPRITVPGYAIVLVQVR